MRDKKALILQDCLYQEQIIQAGVSASSTSMWPPTASKATSAHFEGVSPPSVTQSRWNGMRFRTDLETLKRIPQVSPQRRVLERSYSVSFLKKGRHWCLNCVCLLKQRTRNTVETTDQKRPTHVAGRSHLQLTWHFGWGNCSIERGCQGCHSNNLAFLWEVRTKDVDFFCLVYEAFLSPFLRFKSFSNKAKEEKNCPEITAEEIVQLVTAPRSTATTCPTIIVWLWYMEGIFLERKHGTRRNVSKIRAQLVPPKANLARTTPNTSFDFGARLDSSSKLDFGFNVASEAGPSFFLVVLGSLVSSSTLS